MVIRIAADDSAPETARRATPRRDSARPESGTFLPRLTALLRRLPAILLVASLPLLAAQAYLKLVPPKFVAVAKVFADPAGGRVGGAATQPSEGYIPFATSRPVLDRAIERGGLSTDPAIVIGPAPLAQRLLDFLGRIRGQDVQAPDRRAAVFQHLGTFARASASPDANVIDVSVAAVDPTTAARLANAVAQAFVEEAAAALDRRPAAGGVRQVRKGDDLRNRLRDAEAALQRFRTENGIAAGGPATELGRVRAQAADSKARYEQIQNLLSSGRDVQGIAETLRLPALDQMRIQLSEAIAQEASMRSTLGPRHPSYIAAQNNIQEKRKLLAEALRLAATAARSDWQAATAQAVDIERRSGATGQPAAAPFDAGRLVELERAVETARATLDQYLKSAEGAAETSIARIHLLADKPGGPPSPQPGTVWSIAALVSALLAALVALPALFSSAPARSRLRREPDAAPPVRRAPHAEPYRQDSEAEPAAYAAPQAEPARGYAGVERRKNGEAGAARSPQAAALVKEVSERAWSVALQTTLVVGTDGADAASVALDIAIGAAAENLRVLLLDADERSPDLSRLLSDVPLSAYITLHGRKRAIGAFESRPGHTIWIAPAETFARGKPVLHAPLILTSLTGHFDLLIMTGAHVGAGAGEEVLAAASEIVAVVTPGKSHDLPDMAARLRVPAHKVRIIPGAAPVSERRRANQDDEAARPTSLFRFQDD